MVHISDTLQSFMPAKLKTWLKWAIYTEITYPDLLTDRKPEWTYNLERNGLSSLKMSPTKTKGKSQKT